MILISHFFDVPQNTLTVVVAVAEVIHAVAMGLQQKNRALRQGEMMMKECEYKRGREREQPRPGSSKHH
jgi:hypothetical protein